jgi:DNA-binding MarR family transcriptional regulator
VVNFSIEVEAYMVKLFNCYIELNKKTYEYCQGIPLYPSEVHAIEYIATSSTTNMTDISRALGLTKGAVSKMVVKLEKIGLLKRYKYLYNQKEVYLHLTELGVKVCEGHSTYHATMYKTLENYYKDRSEHDQETILEFLKLYFLQMQELKKVKLSE